MHKTGTLTISAGISQLDGTRLARANSPNPFGAATNFLSTRGLNDQDFIFVDGSNGTVGSIPVIFITDAGPAASAMASILGIAARKKSSKKPKARRVTVKNSKRPARNSKTRKSAAKPSSAKRR